MSDEKPKPSKSAAKVKLSQITTRLSAAGFTAAQIIALVSVFKS